VESINEQVERLIVRSLDGELTDDEQLALDRELIRDPDARILMDEYRNVDSACASAMSSWLDAGEVQSSKFEVQRERQQGVGWAVPIKPSRARQGDQGGSVVSEALRVRRAQGEEAVIRQLTIGNRQLTRRHHYRQLLILIPGAIAAALLAIVFPWPAKHPNGDAHSTHSLTSGLVDEALSNHRPSVVPHYSNNETSMRSAAWTNPATYRGTGREVIGIMGDDGNIYWIEVERTRTIERGASPVPADKLNQM